MTAIAPFATKKIVELDHQELSPLVTDEWVTATWQEFVEVMENPTYVDARCYYDINQIKQMRIEVMPVGSAHALDNGIIYFAIVLFCTLKGIPLAGLVNANYIKTGMKGCQPDISYYVGDRTAFAPRSNSIVNLDEFVAPNLVIEISSSTIGDDLGKKRLLYEQLGISEYWVIDVQEVKIIALEMRDGGSWQITESKLLTGLAIATLEEALQLSREKSQSEVGAWLLQKYA